MPGKGGTPQVANASAAATRLRDATFTAQYRGTSAPPQEFTDAELTLYKDGQQRRVDVSLAGTSSALAYSEIVNGDGHFLCFQDSSVLAEALAGELGAGTSAAHGVAGSPLCTHAASGTNSIFDFDTLATTLVRDDFLPTAPRTIAGEVGDCYAGSDTGSGAPEEMCISPRGALLYLSTSDGQQDELRATSTEPTVDDRVFALPYPVIDAPAGRPQ